MNESVQQTDGRWKAGIAGMHVRQRERETKRDMDTDTACLLLVRS